MAGTPGAPGATSPATGSSAGNARGETFGESGAVRASATWSPEELIRDRSGTCSSVRIESAGGDPDKVRIVAVAKTFPAAAIRAALAAGLVDFGENYADELAAKARRARRRADDQVATSSGPSNATSSPAWRRTSVLRGRDADREGRDIARRAPGASVFVEVDTTGLDSDTASRHADAPALVQALPEHRSRSPA
jgi:hypothetical protein